MQKTNMRFEFLAILKAMIGEAMIGIVVISLIISASGRVYGQAEEMAQIDAVNELLDQLNSEIIDDRVAAEEKLIAMPANVLDYIDVPDVNATPDYIQRLLRVRKQLETKATQNASKASRVTLVGGMSINDAIEEIKAQTRNIVFIRPDVAAMIGQKEIEFDSEQVSFWAAVNEIMSQGELEVDTYGGAAGQLSLTPKTITGSPRSDEPKNRTSSVPPQATAGVLQLAINRVNSSRNLTDAGLNYTSLQMRVRWEPRINPISIQLDPNQIKIVDNLGNTISPQRKSMIEGSVQSEIPELKFALTTPLIDRKIEKIKTLTGTVDAVLPGRVETFRFRSLDDFDGPSTQLKSGARVTYHGYVENEDLFGVTVELGFEAQSNELDSYQGWVFDNEVVLKKGKEMFEPIASETVARKNNNVTVEYFFEEHPGQCDLIYKTPAAIVNVSFDFEINDIILP